MTNDRAVRPQADEVHVWYQLTETLTSEAIEAAEAILSSEERVRSRRFHFSEDRRDYAAAHALLRRSLSRYVVDVPPAEWRFGVADGGKPYVEETSQGLSFNLSHTRGLVACAIARDIAVGIDVERTDRAANRKGIADRYFSPVEVRNVDWTSEGAAGSFVDLWTLKEAFIKAIGTGLSQPLNTMPFDLSNAKTISFLPPPGMPPSEWRFALCAPTCDSRLAVAARRGEEHEVRLCVNSAGVDRPPRNQLLRASGWVSAGAC